MSFNLKAFAMTAGLSFTSLTAAFLQNKSELKLHSTLLPRTGVAVNIYPDEVPGKTMIGYSDETRIIGVWAKTLEIHAIDGLNKKADGRITEDEIVYYKYVDQNFDTEIQIIEEGQKISGKYFPLDPSSQSIDRTRKSFRKLSEISQIKGFLPRL